MKEMSPLAMINVSARWCFSTPNQQTVSPHKNTRHTCIRQGKTPVSYLLFYDFIIKFRHIFWLAEISLLLNLTLAALGRIINPGKARRSLSLCAIPSAAKQLSLAPGAEEEQECGSVCVPGRKFARLYFAAVALLREY
jgi:hypothetical protein